MPAQVISIAGGAAAWGPASGGKVHAINNLDNLTFRQVIGANPMRTSLTFHNPGQFAVYVAPLADFAGAPLLPTTNALGGAFLLGAGVTMIFAGECQLAWGAVSSAGFSQPLTVMDSNV